MNQSGSRSSTKRLRHDPKQGHVKNHCRPSSIKNKYIQQRLKEIFDQEHIKNFNLDQQKVLQLLISQARPCKERITAVHLQLLISQARPCKERITAVHLQQVA
jgi:hypothetical protein